MLPVKAKSTTTFGMQGFNLLEMRVQLVVLSVSEMESWMKRLAILGSLHVINSWQFMLENFCFYVKLVFYFGSIAYIYCSETC